VEFLHRRFPRPADAEPHRPRRKRDAPHRTANARLRPELVELRKRLERGTLNGRW
jgi:hypothetical protein